MGLIPVSENSRGIGQIIVSTIFLLLATLAIAARVWARRIMQLALSINDYAAIFALAWLYGIFGITITMVVAAGQGQHQANVTPGQVRLLLQLLLCIEVAWAFSCAAVKISILDLYTRIFPTKKICQACYGLMALTVIFASMVILIAFLLCRPLPHFWDRASQGTCGNQAIAFLSSGCLNVLLDLMIVILPMPKLWRLKMTLRRKLGIMVLFGIGATICIVSIVRLVALRQINNSDLTWSNELPSLWTFLEPALSIINTCLPVTQPVANKASEFLGIKGASSVAAQPSAMHGNNVTRNFTRLDDPPYYRTEGTGTYNNSSYESAYGWELSGSGINVNEDLEIDTIASAPRPSVFGNVPKDLENDTSAGVPLPLPHGL